MKMKSTHRDDRSYEAKGRNACSRFGGFCLYLAMILLTVSNASAAEIRVSNHGLTAYELSIWRSEEFKKRMAESYLSQTEIEPAVTERERDTLLDVFERMDANDLAGAAEMMKGKTKEGSSAACDFTLANLYWQLDQTDLAAASYSKATKKHPKYFQAWKNLGLMRAQNGQYDKAVPALTKALELGGGDPLIYGLLGYAYNNLGNSIAAESAFRMATVLDPDAFDWKQGLVSSLANQGRFVDVAAMCGVLIAEAPDNADLWEYQAKAYIGMEDLPKAVVNYEMIDQLGASTVERLNTLGDIYVNQQLFSMATEAYLRAVDMAATSATNDEEDTVKELPGRIIDAARVLAANGAYTQSDQLVEALESRLDGELSEEHHIEVLKVRVRIAVAQGSGEDVIAMLENIVALNPLDGEALILLGQNYSRAEEYEKAAFQFERAESLDDYKAEALVYHAQLLVRQRKYTEALPLLRNAQRIHERSDVQDFLEQVERAAR